MPTVVPAMLNLGLAGQPYVTHDIAGFARGTGPSDEELYMRWTELGAFTPVMRTHEGANKEGNWSWEKSPATTAHFRRFVLEQGAVSRSVYLPAGTWYNAWSGAAIAGGGRVTVDAPMGYPPVFSLGVDRPELRQAESLASASCR